jgi:carboxymethylenebutenolidase
MGLLAGLSLVLATGAHAPEPIMESTARFDSRGKSIPVEQFEPKAPGRYPAVVILHGAGGMPAGGIAFRAFARVLARQGYVALIPHYFDRTGTAMADDRTIPKHFAAWMETVADAVTYAASRPNVDPGRIGLLGFSLGGYLSLSTATLDPRIQVIVEFFGGLPDALAGGVARLPPVLILHGDADTVVPVAEAHKLERLLKENRVPYEIHIYRGAGHGFLGDAGEDSGRRTQAFFDAHLKKTK